jgi:ketosteroid isomerase-like protein
MSMLRRTFAALPAAAAAAAQTGAAGGEARKALDSFISAVQRNDVAAVSRYLAEDLIYTHSTGLVENKSQYLAKLKGGDQKYTSIELVNPVIRSYGDAAVLNTQAQFKGSTKGVPFDNTLFLMQVWVRQGGSWKLVAHQTTRKQ